MRMSDVALRCERESHTSTSTRRGGGGFLEADLECKVKEEETSMGN